MLKASHTYCEIAFHKCGTDLYLSLLYERVTVTPAAQTSSFVTVPGSPRLLPSCLSLAARAAVGQKPRQSAQATGSDSSERSLATGLRETPRWAYGQGPRFRQVRSGERQCKRRRAPMRP